MTHIAYTHPAFSPLRWAALPPWLALGALIVAATTTGCADDHKEVNTAAASIISAAATNSAAATAAASAAAEASQTITCRGKPNVTPWASKLTVKGTSTSVTFTTVQPPNGTASADASPAQGNNTFTVEIKDLAGAAVADGTIELVSTMPEHSHPPPPAVSAKIAGGKATLPEVQLFMSGLWHLKLTVQPTGKSADIVELSICLEG